MRRADAAGRGARHRLGIVAVLAALVLLTGAAPGSAGTPAPAPGTDSGAEPTTRCTVTDPRLPEISGAVWSGDSLVVANDKGASLFHLDASCSVTRVQDLLAGRPAPVRRPARLDVEDLARGPDGTVWLVDSGGNRFSRNEIRLLGARPDGSLAQVAFRYPVGRYDAEAALVTLDSQLVLLTKEPGRTAVYSARIPGARADEPSLLRRLGTIDLTTLPGEGSATGQLVTGAALSPDGRHVAVRTYTAVFEWTVENGDVAGSLLTDRPRLVTPLDQAQGEAIAYVERGSALVALSEQLPAPVLQVPAGPLVAAQQPATTGFPLVPTWMLLLLLGPALLLVLGTTNPFRRRPRQPRDDGRIRRWLRAAHRFLAARAVRSASACVLLVWMAGAAATGLVDREHESQAVVAFAPRDPTSTGAETMVLVMPKYVEVLRSPDVMDRAASQVDRDTERIRRSSSAVVEPNTLNLVVRTTDIDPAVAARTAQVLAAGIIETAAADPLVRAELVAPSTAGTQPVAPTPEHVRLLSLGLGVLAGAVVGFGVARRRAVGPRGAGDDAAHRPGTSIITMGDAQGTPPARA